MSASFPDGMLTTSTRGEVCRVFAPPRWAIWRWIEWLRCPRDRRLTETRASVDIRLIASVGEHCVAKIVPQEERVRLIVIATRAS